LERSLLTVKGGGWGRGNQYNRGRGFGQARQYILKKKLKERDIGRSPDIRTVFKNPTSGVEGEKRQPKERKEVVHAGGSCRGLLLRPAHPKSEHRLGSPSLRERRLIRGHDQSSGARRGAGSSI